MASKSVLLFFSVGVIGGAETNFISIAKELKAHGIKVYLAVVKNNGPLLELIDPYIEDKIILDFTRIVYFPYTINNYKNFIRQKGVHTVLNFGLKVEIFSRVFSKLFGAKRVISNIRSTDDWRKFYHTYVDRISQFNVDLWVANSHAGKDAFIKREKIPPRKCLVIYNYVDDDLPLLREKPINENLTIGILSNIKTGKGFDDLISLAKLLKTKDIQFKFIIAGKDLMNGHFQATLLEHNLENHFILWGYIENKKSFFDEIDIFILPTYYEGLPTSILESMMYGVPVISTNVGGIPEIITHQYNGFLTQPGNVFGFYTGIIELTENRDIYQKYRNNSHKVLEGKFVKSKVIAQWLEVLTR